MRSSSKKRSRLWGRMSVLALVVGAIVLLCTGLALAFPDVPSGSDYAEAIEELSNRGIIGGYENGTFGPNNPVTRQQFAKMIALTLDIPVSEADICPFPDVEVPAPGRYADPFFPDNYIAVAADWEITNGYPDGRFRPGNNITRAQVMTMVVRAAQKFGVELSQPTAAYYGDSRYTMRNFTDNSHGLNAQIAEVSGLLWGIRLDSAGVWDPWKNATRGEVAQILWRLSQKAEPVTTTTTTYLPPVDQLASDDFSDPSSGWAESIDDDFIFQYTDLNDYEMTVLAPDSECISWYPHRQFDDGYVEAWAWPSEVSGSWEYGLIFRNQGDLDNFYELSVTGDGLASLWKRVNGQWSRMSQSVDLPALAPDGWRYLEVFMIGDYFAAYVDDVFIGEFEDSTFATGNVGFYVGTFDAPSFSTYFDDFAVWGIVY